MEKTFGLFVGAVIFIFLGISPEAESVRKMRGCAFNSNSPCRPTDFKCHSSNGCIEREKFCNGFRDCLDGSDEKYCNGVSPYSEARKKFSRCTSSEKYIPIEWVCNGRSDCENREDEKDCNNKLSPNAAVIAAREKAIQWLKNQIQGRSETEKWGKLVQKSAVALYLADTNFTIGFNSTKLNSVKELAYEASIRLLSKLSRKNLNDLSSSELANYVNAFLVTCVNSRNFHGINLIKEIRKRVDSANGSNPYLLLTLCNAGEYITKSDKKKVIEAFYRSPRESWTETQAIAVMALSCARSQSKEGVSSEKMRGLTMELTKRQYENGTVFNLQATALVMQALYSAESDEDPMNFNEAKALLSILSHQQEDGSFGNLMKTYYVLPVLSCKSLVNISSSHCNIEYKNEKSGMQDLENRVGKKIKVWYSVWIDEQKDKEKKLTLRVPFKTSAYEFMEIAAEVDTSYRFEYTVKDQKPYISAISGVIDDAENGMFWFPYVFENGRPVAVETSPVDFILKDYGHFLMWYRSVSWTSNTSVDRDGTF